MQMTADWIGKAAVSGPFHKVRKLGSELPITVSGDRTTGPTFACFASGRGPAAARGKSANRRTAIRSAIHGAKKDDVILLAGKGHETYQILGKEKIHFSDQEEALRALSEL